MKNEVLIEFFNNHPLIRNRYKVKAEYSTNDNDTKVMVVQETSGSKEVFFGNVDPLYNYFNIELFGDDIETEYGRMTELSKLIGTTHYVIMPGFGKSSTWEIIFKQYTNPRTIQYYDIRRVSYVMTLQCVISKVAETIKN